MFRRRHLPPRYFPPVLRLPWCTDLLHKIGRLKDLRAEHPSGIIKRARCDQIVALMDCGNSVVYVMLGI